MTSSNENTAPERVRSVSRTLWYEVAMLRDLYGYIYSGERVDTVHRNARLEAFLLHARQLFEFFEKNKKCSDDAHALDLVNGEALCEIREGLPKAGEDQCKEANKRVMHMTLERGKGEEDRRPWPLKEIYESLDAAWRLCYDRADREYWHPLWSSCSTPSIGRGLPASNTGHTGIDVDHTGVNEMPDDVLSERPKRDE